MVQGFQVPMLTSRDPRHLLVLSLGSHQVAVRIFVLGVSGRLASSIMISFSNLSLIAWTLFGAQVFVGTSSLANIWTSRLACSTGSQLILWVSLAP